MYPTRMAMTPRLTMNRRKPIRVRPRKDQVRFSGREIEAFLKGSRRVERQDPKTGKLIVEWWDGNIIAACAELQGKRAALYVPLAYFVTSKNHWVYASDSDDRLVKTRRRAINDKSYFRLLLGKCDREIAKWTIRYVGAESSECRFESLDSCALERISNTLGVYEDEFKIIAS